MPGSGDVPHFLEMGKRDKGRVWRYLVGLLMLVIIALIGGLLHPNATRKPMATDGVGARLDGGVEVISPILYQFAYAGVLLAVLALLLRWLHGRPLSTAVHGRASINMGWIGAGMVAGLVSLSAFYALSGWLALDHLPLTSDMSLPGRLLIWSVAGITFAALNFSLMAYCGGYLLQGCLRLFRSVPLGLVALVIGQMVLSHGTSWWDMAASVLYALPILYLVWRGNGIELAVGLQTGAELAQHVFWGNAKGIGLPSVPLWAASGMPADAVLADLTMLAALCVAALILDMLLLRRRAAA
ncbi:MAG TPA: hypothetical protein VED40_18435 [Azospirillaceae bacterium]|nr:hypothetical protein [Azospirillaceae bacterium]